MSQSSAQGVRDILGGHAAVQIANKELRIFKVMPKRWIVERSFVWLEKNRQMWKNCERLLIPLLIHSYNNIPIVNCHGDVSCHDRPAVTLKYLLNSPVT